MIVASGSILLFRLGYSFGAPHRFAQIAGRLAPVLLRSGIIGGLAPSRLVLPAKTNRHDNPRNLGRYNSKPGAVFRLKMVNADGVIFRRSPRSLGASLKPLRICPWTAAVTGSLPLTGPACGSGAAAAFKHFADKADIAHNEFRHRMQLLAFQQMTAAGEALHAILAMTAFDAPAAIEQLVPPPLQPAIRQVGMMGEGLLDLFHFQWPRRIQKADFRE